MLAEKRKILVVDDEKQAADLLKKLLERTGKFAVSVEYEGTKVIDTAAALKPDLILLDVVMPGMRGPTIAYSMRSHEVLCKMPVIFLTGVVPKEHTSPHKMLGEYPLIVKPVDMDEILERIDQICPAPSNPSAH